MSVIEFPDPNKPDPEFVQKDQYGRDMYHYVGDYMFEEKRWSLDIWAYSKEEAKLRFDAINGTSRFLGQLMAKVDA